MVPWQGYAKTEMPASYFAIVMQIQFHVLFSSFEFHCREQLLNYTFRKTLWKNRYNIPGSSKPKTAWRCSSLSTYLLEIVSTSLHSDTTDNYGQHGQHKLVV